MQQKDCRISRQSRLALCVVINVPKNLPLRTSREERGKFPAMRRGRCLHRSGKMHQFLRKSSANSLVPNGSMWASTPTGKTEDL